MTQLTPDFACRASRLQVGRSRTVPVAFALLVLAACTSQTPPPVTVVAGKADLEVLAGEWWGEYSSADSGRQGRIRFQLEAGERTAHGDVVMMTDRSSGVPDPANPASRGPVVEALSIRFVQLDAGGAAVVGNLEPYRDPACGCILSTTFLGHLDGDRISGTYVSNGGPEHPTVTGRWRVDRRGSP